MNRDSNFTNRNPVRLFFHGSASFSEILRTTLRRGAFFEGATGVHDTVEVHRSALRAGATLMRTVRTETRIHLSSVRGYGGARLVT